jgi:phosphoribosylglycinamide formyltransferase-1
MAETLKIAVFASHGGTDLQSLIDGCADGTIDGRVVVVISNNRKSYALERARNHGIDALHLSEKVFSSEEEFTEALIEELRSRDVNLICLAGYMKFLPRRVLQFAKNRVINIHPALLPRHGGKGMYGIHVHEAVIAAGERETGVTVHQVDHLYDHGKIIAQRKVLVLPDDTPESLQERVLEVEHLLYPETVAKIATGEIELE